MYLSRNGQKHVACISLKLSWVCKLERKVWKKMHFLFSWSQYIWETVMLEMFRKLKLCVGPCLSIVIFSSALKWLIRERKWAVRIWKEPIQKKFFFLCSFHIREISLCFPPLTTINIFRGWRQKEERVYSGFCMQLSCRNRMKILLTLPIKCL